MPVLKSSTSARGGVTSFHIMPGLSASEGLAFQPDTTLNIDRALSFQPLGIIVNMPPMMPPTTSMPIPQMEHFRTLQRLAKTAGSDFGSPLPNPIILWPQTNHHTAWDPRFYPALFWQPCHWLVYTPGRQYPRGCFHNMDSGDGIHLNDKGHRLIFETVINLNL